ncbi:MAG TPA: hypothetical protein PKC69_01505 [Chitinophagaceae bacterium]|nr:hypothetical protein [Chitinophagaceae bacterium]
MKKTFVLIFSLLLILGACGDNKTKTEGTGQDSAAAPEPAPPPAADSIAAAKKDSLLMRQATTILQWLKNKNFAQLAAQVHPAKGVRFSPYGYIDVAGHKILKAAELRNPDQLPEKINWGVYDGSGDPIEAGIQFYFDRFVYDKDFLKAEKKAVNQFLGSGNSLNNLKEVYPGCDFVEFYFPGFDPKYEGMDWVTLRLVFQTEKNSTYLVGIVHDQWTI